MATISTQALRRLVSRFPGRYSLPTLYAVAGNDLALDADHLPEEIDRVEAALRPIVGDLGRVQSARELESLPAVVAYARRLSRSPRARRREGKVGR